LRENARRKKRKVVVRIGPTKRFKKKEEETSIRVEELEEIYF
jgi:hypothetical protein